MLGVFAGAATMGSNAKATTKGAIMLLTNLVFISVISFCCFGLLEFSSLGIISGCSLRYSVRFGGALRGKCRRLANHGSHGCHECVQRRLNPMGAPRTHTEDTAHQTPIRCAQGRQ